MDQLSKAKASLEKAIAAGNKQQINQLKQKIVKLSETAPSSGVTSKRVGRPGPRSREYGIVSNSKDQAGVAPTIATISRSDITNEPKLDTFPTYLPNVNSYTAYRRDRNFTQQPEVICVPLMSVNWAFQGGTVPFPILLSSITTTMTNLYSVCVSIWQAKHGRQWINPTLNNPLASMTQYLNDFTNAFIQQRMLESLVGASPLNDSVSNITNSIDALALNAIVTSGRALRNVPVPAELVNLLDKMCGLKSIGEGAPAVALGWPTISGNMADLTNPGDVLAATGAIQALITGLNPPGGTLTGVDLSRIWSFFSIAYGIPNYADKKISNNIAEYWQGYNMVVSFDDTAATQLFVYPALSETVNLLPIYMPDGMDKEDAKWMQSHLGWVSFTTDTIPEANTNIPNVIGLLSNLNVLHESTWGVYNATANTLFPMSAVGAGPTNAFLSAGADYFNWMQAASLESTQANEFSDDHRMHIGFKRTYVSGGELSDATDYKILTMFRDAVK